MRCKYCNTTIDFKAGAKKLLRHSETVKHQLNTPETSSTVKQVTLEQTIDKTATVRAKELELKEAAKNLEIKLVRSASRHMVSFTYLECIVDIFKECVGDSEIVKKLTLCEQNSRYLANYGISMSAKGLLTSLTFWPNYNFCSCQYILVKNLKKNKTELCNFIQVLWVR